MPGTSIVSFDRMCSYDRPAAGFQRVWACEEGLAAVLPLQQQAADLFGALVRHRLKMCTWPKRVPSIFLTSSFRTCLNCEVLKGMFAWRTGTH